MKIVIAPDSFKESLSAEKCCQAIKAGFSTLFPDAHYICLPIADGGEGTVDAMVAATGGKIVTHEVCAIDGRKSECFLWHYWGWENGGDRDGGGKWPDAGRT